MFSYCYLSIYLIVYRDYNFNDINVTLYLRFNHGFLCRIWCFRDSFRVCFVSCWCWNLQPWDFQRVVRGALLILQCNFLQQIFPRYCLPQVTTQWQTQGGHLPPLFLDQTKARGAEKNVFGDCPPYLSQALDDLPPPSTLPDGLDPPLQHIHVIAIMLSLKKKTTTTTTTKKEAK